MAKGAGLATADGEIARRAGLRRGRALTLTDIDKRRAELWAVSVLTILLATVAVVAVGAGGAFFGDGGIFSLPRWVLMVLVVGLAGAFLVYVIEKERSLRALARLLVEQQVLTSTLTNRLAGISRLSEVGRAVNATLELEDVLPLILTCALEGLGGTEGSVMLVGDDGVTLRVASHRGVLPKIGDRSSCISGTVALTRTPVLVQRDQLPQEVRDSGYLAEHVRSALCVPLVRRDELLGVLTVNETRGARRFDDHDLEALGFFADYAAIAIGNARIFEQERATIARLEELDRLKDDFVATVTHELKTPLTAIIGAAATIQRKGERMGPEHLAGFLDMIERQGRHLLGMVDGMLSAARIEAGQNRFRRSEIDLRSLAEAVIADLAHSRTGRGRRVELTCEPERPKMWGDAGAVQQILINLIDNALKYSGDNSPIEVSVRETPGDGMIEVIDRGVGMSPEQLETVFDRFRQVDSSSTRAVGGFGLGLYIVKNLVAGHDGSIEVRSTPGAGTAFVVRFPKRGNEEGRRAAEPATSELFA